MNLDLPIENTNPGSLHAFPVRNPTKEDCADTSGTAGRYSTVQCFICSRIYFDQKLSRCPRCNSDSLQHYTTADLNYFARERVGDSFKAGAVIHDQQ